MPKFKLGIGLALAASTWTGSVGARTGSKLNYDAFREQCTSARLKMRTRYYPPPVVGSTIFGPTGALQATQTRFSFVRLRKAMRKATTRKGEPVWFDRKLGVWTMRYDKGHSLFPIEKKVAVVYYRGEFYIVDGHHRSLISTYVMAESIPMEILADWSHLEPAEFETRMGSDPHHYAHWRDQHGALVPRLDLCDLVNDPNLLLARLILYRVDVRIEADDNLIIEEGRGAGVALMIKINKDMPFYEFEVADALYRAGVRFDDTRREHDLTRKELRRYIQILRKARDEPGSRLPRILLLDNPTPIAKLILPTVIMNHVRKQDCREWLSVRERAED